MFFPLMFDSCPVNPTVQGLFNRFVACVVNRQNARYLHTSVVNVAKPRSTVER